MAAEDEFPPAPVQARVKTVRAAMVCASDPEVPVAREVWPLSSESVQLDAFVELQVSVVVLFLRTKVGFAFKVAVEAGVGGGAGGWVTFTMALAVGEPSGPAHWRE